MASSRATRPFIVSTHTTRLILTRPESLILNVLLFTLYITYITNVIFTNASLQRPQVLPLPLYKTLAGAAEFQLM
ncbi:hypothetical protein E2C01_057996 [Portunus trituberculatus]|uniref:Uncharacterized protein n=1 Tax=Portunus trituberculatus TaxID=210409 RepID=A0A5B7H444_PORTR|nr:hypothetical protein [Portunus trituberculatus]